MSKGHTTERERTADVQTDGDPCTFADLLLQPAILQGLEAANYVHPSPIQLKAIPLGRFGVDLIAQAKSGTGKTCVFSVIALEAVVVANKNPQVLMLAPTREIALQIRDVVRDIGAFLAEGATTLQCHCFIGGIPMSDDLAILGPSGKGCHIAVGTPGRIKALIGSRDLSVRALRMVILDEADKLLDPAFAKEVLEIVQALPARKQVLAVSATFPEEHRKLLLPVMRDPQYVLLHPDTPSLDGVKQYFVEVSTAPDRRACPNLNLPCVLVCIPHRQVEATPPQGGSSAGHVQASKMALLQDLLNAVSFYQCIVFCNRQSWSTAMVEALCDNGWPAAAISGLALAVALSLPGPLIPHGSASNRRYAAAGAASCDGPPPGL